MKKVFKALLVCMLVAALAATSFIIPVSAAKVDDASETGRIYPAGNVNLTHDKRVAYILSEFPDGEEISGTAFLFGDNALMTAAHNVYDIDHGGEVVDITVYPGGTGSGYGYSHLKDKPIYDSSIKGTKIGKNWDFNKDWAIFKTYAELGNSNRCGHFNFTKDVTTNDDLAMTDFKEYNRTQFTGYGRASSVSSNMIYHKISTVEGSDGAPIYKKVGNIEYVVGIVSGQNSNYNFATRITDDIFDKMLEFGRQHYHIEYDANGGSGSMKDTIVDYGRRLDYNLRKNTFTNGGAQFIGWKAYNATDDTWLYRSPYNYTDQHWIKEGEEADGWTKVTYSDGACVNDIATSKHIALTLYAQWKNFTVKYYADEKSAKGSMEDTKVYYGVGTPLRKNAFTRKGYHLVGWTAYRRSDNKVCYADPTTGSPKWCTLQQLNKKGYNKYIYNDEQKTACASSIHEDVVEMHAVWSKNTYTIHYLANYGHGTMNNTEVDYGVTTKLAANTFTNSKKKFVGWTAYRGSDFRWIYTNPNTNAKAWYKESEAPAGWTKYIYADGASVKNLSTVNKDHISLYAQWENIETNFSVNNTIKGDVNADGSLTIDDITMIQRYLAELVVLNETQITAADVNNDGEVNIGDITALQVIINN